MREAMKTPISMYEKSPRSFGVRSYKSGEKEKIVAYMESFEPYAVAGRISDCVTGRMLQEENVGFTDGEFSWSSQDIYHVKEYDAAVSSEFVEKIYN